MNTHGTEKSMASQPLKLWEKVLIIVGGGAEAGTYVGRIEDFTDGGVVVTTPEFLSGKTRLRDDLPVCVQMTRDDAIYQFDSHLLKHGTGTTGHVTLAAPRNLRRVQRRLFVRIEWREAVEYAQLSTAVDWGVFPRCFSWHCTVMQDISGGGIGVRAVTTVNPGDVLLLRLPKFGGAGFPEYVFAVCRRVWDADGTSQLGLEFILEDRLGAALGEAGAAQIPTQLRQFTRVIQNKLVVWIFQRQIALRQKGLL